MTPPSAAVGDLDDLLPDGEPEPGPGDILCDRYLIDSRLGKGGYTVILGAIDLGGADAQRSVVLKLPRPSARHLPVVREALARERQALSELSHPLLRRVLALEDAGDGPILILERLDGDRLTAADPSAATMAMARDLVETVAFLHDHDWLHCDLKPSNVLLCDRRPRLIDLGCACRRGVPRGNGFALTPRWASPQAQGGATPQPDDDVFSLACLLYWLWTGEHPFGRLPSVEARRLRCRPDLGRLPSSWRRVLGRALALDTSDRPSAGDLLAAMSPSAVPASGSPLLRRLLSRPFRGMPPFAGEKTP
jgi:serine/threonine protein kinase